jgi:chitinase
MNFKIIAYFPDWTGSVDAIPFDKITHINYSFVLPTPVGGLTALDEPRMKDLVAKAHAKGVKVSIAIGGWNGGNCNGFEAMAAGSGNRRTFVRNVIEMCDSFHLDGVDIDWEYPHVHSGPDFTVLMRELRAALGPQRLLTAAVIAENEYQRISSYIQSEVFQYLDCLNIMAYDWGYQAPGTHHSSLELATRCLDYWAGRGCPREKLILGAPFYGRNHNAALNYRELIAKDPMAPYKDNVEGFLYDGLETMRKKTRIALSKAGGIMFWEITQDVPGPASLLGAIHETAVQAAR